MVKALFVSLSIISLVIFGSSCSKEGDPVVTANENIYINELYSSGNDWLEIYNDNSVSKNVSGYLIYDDVNAKYPLPSNTTIPAKGFLVLHCDGTGVGLFTNFKLSSSGETVYLENTSGQVIDKVIFPAMVNGQSYGRYPDGSSTFAISGSPSEGSSNGAVGTPAISSVTRMPLVPGLGEVVTLTAELAVISDITSVKLFYRYKTGKLVHRVFIIHDDNNFFGGIASVLEWTVCNVCF